MAPNMVQIRTKIQPNIMFLKLKGYSDFVRVSVNACLLYLIWSVIHFIASQMYPKFCVPFSPYGFIISIFMVSTPHCIALRWAVYNGAAAINNMWLLLGCWIISSAVSMLPTVSMFDFKAASVKSN